MKINRQYMSDANTYAGNVPIYIVIHNTDNFAEGADALAHAKCQYNSWWTGGSCHYYVDDGDTVYQAAPHNRGCWHVGKDYGGRLYGIASNTRSVGIEMCVQQGYNYEKAFQNTVELCKMLMNVLNIDADHVIQHYDATAKNCPSVIRAKGDWKRFKQLIKGGSMPAPSTPEESVSFTRINSGICTGDGVRVRKGPDTSFDIEYKLNKGNRFDVDGQISNGWYHIHIKNGSTDLIGWIYGDYVKLDTSIQTVDIATGKYGLEVTADSLRYRSTPGNGEVKGSYSRGTKLFPSSRTIGGHFGTYWFNMGDNNWCSGEFLKGWVYDVKEKKWWWLENGSYPKQQWRQIGGAWYYFCKDGYMAADTYVKSKDKNIWYYLDENGAWKTEKDVYKKPDKVSV